jgi:hypothetical protein
MLAGVGRKLFSWSRSVSASPEGIKLLFEVIAGFGLLIYTRTTEVLEIGNGATVSKAPRTRLVNLTTAVANRQMNENIDPFSKEPITLPSDYHCPIPNAGSTNPHSDAGFHEVELG